MDPCVVVWLSRNNQQDAACNGIYYSKSYWSLNMFRAAYRSSSGALNCICSLWFIYTCGDRPLSRLARLLLLAASCRNICTEWHHQCYNLCVFYTITITFLFAYYIIQLMHFSFFHWQEHQAHAQIDDTHIRPHTKLILNERKSSEDVIVTAQSTAYGPPEDGRIKRTETCRGLFVFKDMFLTF